jgi:hypothetical protein
LFGVLAGQSNGGIRLRLQLKPLELRPATEHSIVLEKSAALNMNQQEQEVLPPWGQ